MTTKCRCDHEENDHGVDVDLETNMPTSQSACLVYDCICGLFEPATTLRQETDWSNYMDLLWGSTETK